MLLVLSIRCLYGNALIRVTYRCRCWSRGRGLWLSRNNRLSLETTTCNWETTSWMAWTGWLTPGAGEVTTRTPGWFCPLKCDCLSCVCLLSHSGATVLSWPTRWGWERPFRPSPFCPTCFTSTSCTGPSSWWCLCPRSPPGRGSLRPGPQTWTWWSILGTSWAVKR